MGQTEELEEPTGAAQIASIYGEHAVALRKRCLRLTHDAAAADDLMQETFARVLARAGELPDDLNARGYLLATARNIWLNQLRKQGEVPITEVDEARTADDRIENDPLRALLLAEQRDDVRRGAARLPERQRRALTLRELGDRSYAEIGSELGLHANAVAQVVWRARTQLRRSLRRSQIDIDVLPADCRARLDVMSDLVDETPSRDTAALEAHMVECRDCRRTLAAYQEAGSRLRGIVPLAPLLALVARVGTVLRTGAEMSAGIGTAAVVTAAAVATAGGGGALVSHYGTPWIPSGAMHHARAHTASNVSSAVRARSVAAVRRASDRRQGSGGSSASRARSPRPRPTRHLEVTAAVATRPRTDHHPAPSGLPMPAPARPAHPAQTADARPASPPITEKNVTPAPGQTRPPEDAKTPPGKDKAKNAKAATPPPGQSQPAADAKTPPGQDKPKHAKAAPDPPGQSQPAADAKTPPGQDKPKHAKAAPDPPGQSQAAADAKTPPGQRTARPTSSPGATAPVPVEGADASAPANGSAPDPTPKGHGHQADAPASSADGAPALAPATTPTAPPPATTMAPVTDPSPAGPPAAPASVPPGPPSDPSGGNGKGHGPK